MSERRSTMKVEYSAGKVGPCGKCQGKTELVRNPRGGPPLCMRCREQDDQEHTHVLKTLPMYFEAVLSGKKHFECRIDDRNFQIGDLLQLRELQEHARLEVRYTGRIKTVRVTYILRGAEAEIFGIKPGYAVLSIEDAIIIGPDVMDGDRAVIEMLAAVVRNGIPPEIQLSFIIGVPIGLLMKRGWSEQEVLDFVMNTARESIRAARSRLANEAPS